MLVGIGGLVVGSSISAGGGALALAGYLYRHRESPGVPWFIASAVAVSVWCLAYGVALLVSATPLREHLTALWLCGAIWTGPLFLLFALAYTGRTAIARSWPGLAVLAIPTVGSGLLLTHTAHSLWWTEFTVAPVFGLSTASYALQPVAYLVTVFTLLCAGVAVLLLFETVISYGPLYRGEAIALALSVVPPAAGSLPWLFGFGPYPQLNLSPALFVLHLTLDGYAFVEKDMFETNPTTQRAAERSALDDIPTPLFALDPEDRVVTVNDAAVEIFDLDRDAVLGRPLDGAVPVERGPDGAWEAVTVTAAGRERQFTVATAPLTDPAGTVVGSTVVLQEVTREREREQRLDVLNRVIRHNLRNEMTVIMGHADIVADRTDDPELTTSAGRITDSAERLLATGEKARKFERVRASQAGPKSVDVAGLLSDVVADIHAEYPAAAVDVDVRPATTTQRTDPRVLSLVVGSLVENAVEHNDTDSPRVRIALSEVDGDLEIRISDNGPGIDADELAPIQSGTETDLQHSTGIGLWVASWGMTMLGGDLEFTDTSDGTEVVVRLRGDADPERTRDGQAV
ncbi:histidine kinase N-terminal 7TM domain-containing protein [Haloarcula onubensis]|uniref:histidine kinase n=1 Tax=Haloarcula onubensis TaxID=2950539 RepID=A0ABU2FU36_9EURY|nr:histidine kinase N-terminal 7TM domain-containing protein [Halomicroarcula sp. S3CR25-11]MDS0283671.1 ATP-binding protein [Halomicroarcula sp. S3CR25-11]